ncbi:TPA_asm: L protein [Psilorhabdovirus 1]|nr:TPA_asm: L protein [Psilorhabdovirus 1]
MYSEYVMDIDPLGFAVEELPEDPEFPNDPRDRRQLRQEDYTLDSPVILDDLTVAFQHRNVTSFQGSLHQRRLSRLYSLLESPIEPESIHQRIAELILQWMESIRHSLKRSSRLDPFLRRFKVLWNPPSGTDEVVRSFFESLHPDCKHVAETWKSFSKLIQTIPENPDQDVIIYWVLYTMFHLLILLMNKVDNREIIEILTIHSDILEGTPSETPDEYDHISLSLPFIGRVILGPHGCCLLDHNLVLDKNFTLMVQDMLSNRQNTLTILYYPDKRYSSGLLEKCQNLYNAGDNLIRICGNASYDLIKMIEPICNNNIRKLAERDSDVSSSTAFQEYLDCEIRAMEEKYGEPARRWFLELLQIDNIYDAIFVFGMFRHWGHPFIEYYEGLLKLHQNVTVEKEIDADYVNSLASDLARRIIKSHFRRCKEWPVDLNELPINSILYKHVRDSTWPNKMEERAFGDHWHELPMTKVYDVPTSVNLSEVIDDKSHSLNLPDLKKAIRQGSIGSSQKRKVLISTLFSEEINIEQFIKTIDQEGINRDDLVIGLRAKERELKRIGRFFALMTFKLRLYFVTTELMISKHILPLFPSLTMTNSLNDIFKKMIACVPGHGTDQSEHISYAEHFDYEKWNNHQRYESTAPIFRVIDKAFGLSNVITRTHEIFQQSFIYFANKPEHMEVFDNQIRNKPMSPLVCWQGQAGGLEGLRQKGWSIVSLLMINRESKNRNPKVRTLAQGDNQVVCITYKLPKQQSKEDREQSLRELSLNKDFLLKSIHHGAAKLGLIIKPEESWSSFNYLIYGKFALVGGNLICSESKRYSRINVVSNDQVQNMSNSLSSVVTTCLTVGQQSSSVVKPILTYLLYGSYVIRVVLFYNLSVCKQIYTLAEIEKMNWEIIKILLLDSSIGGSGGASLLRFFIRQFPDSVSESLTFWKLIAENTTSQHLKNLALSCGYPKIKTTIGLEDIMKLIESPTSLNCVAQINAVSILKGLVREELGRRINEIKHSTIRECVQFSTLYRGQFLQFLNSIRPKFPRFLSNFYSASIFGFTDSVIGLIQNSRTIRQMFTSKFSNTVCDRIRATELSTIRDLIKIPCYPMARWTCSATRADQLRTMSWGSIVGATIPHPCELLSVNKATDCEHNHQVMDYITCHCKVPPDYQERLQRGPCMPYLGSTTSELTEVYNAWEKKTDYILLKKAVNLRVCLNWFVRPGSTIHQALIKNLQGMTDENADTVICPGPSRGGSYIHRYHAPSQSSGGFSAINHNQLQFMLLTTDTMSSLSAVNYDFMYQSLLLYTQTLLSCLNTESSSTVIYHAHIKCTLCVRPVAEEFLSSDLPPPPLPSLYHSNSLFVGKEHTPFVTDKLHLRDITPISLSEFADDVSRQIGITQGFLHTVHQCYDLGLDDLGVLFPKAVFDRLDPEDYLTGFLSGIIRGTIINSLTQQFMFSMKDRASNLKGQTYLYISKLTETKDIASLISSERFSNFLSRISHITGAQYPLNEDEVLDLLRTFLISRITSNFMHWVHLSGSVSRVIIFPETMTAFIACGLLFSIKLARGTILQNNLRRKEISYYQKLLKIASSTDINDERVLIRAINRENAELRLCDSDMRVVSKDAIIPTRSLPLMESHKYCEYEGGATGFELQGSTLKTSPSLYIHPTVDRYCPLIPGLRLVQIQTGAHYKLKCLLRMLKKPPTFAVCCGDYSGGFSSLLLRRYPNVKVYFNSLIDIAKFPSGGIHPSPPSAISRLPSCQRDRCINLQTAWEELSDLRELVTWRSIISKCGESIIDLIIVDAEVTDVQSASQICQNLLQILPNCRSSITVIYKCFASLLTREEYNILDQLQTTFDKVSAYTTEYTGCLSSEFYVICSNIRRRSDRLYTDVTSYVRLNNLVRCMKTPQEEFHRACLIDINNSCIGLTSGFWLQAEIVLSGLLLSMEIAPVIAEKIAQAMRETCTVDDFLGAVLFGMSYVMKELNVRVNQRIGVIPGYPIPSADWLEKYGAFILGSMIYIFYFTRDCDGYTTLIDTKSFLVHYKIIQERFSWSFRPRFDCNRCMKLRLSSRKHLAATWIRVWESFRFERSINIQPPRTSRITEVLSHHIQRLSYNQYNLLSLRFETGFIDCLRQLNLDPPILLSSHRCRECPAQ